LLKRKLYVQEASSEEVEPRRQLYEQKTSFEDTVVDYKPKYYTLSALPEEVNLRDIKWKDRKYTDSGDNPFAVFKCKNDCKTIFTYENILEMNRFAEELTAMKEWPQYCIRSSKEGYGDGFGCSVKAYRNLTSYLDVVSMVNQTQDEIDTLIKAVAPQIIKEPSIRGTLGKNFSVEYPFTKFASV
jgi:hypothetical protein